MPVPRRLVVAVVVICWLVAGCSVEQTPSVLSNSAGTTTTTLNLDETADLPQLPGTPPDEITRALQQAITDRDMCALAAAMDSGLPETNDPDAVIDAYVALQQSINAATEFRPAELAGAFDELASSLELAVAELRATVGRTDAPSVVAVFSTDAMRAAVRSVQRWQTQNCEPPAS